MRDERDMVLGCGCWVRRWRDRDERQGREMRDRGERVKDERQNRGERVRLNIYIYIYNTCYNAILYSITKKFIILLFSIL